MKRLVSPPSDERGIRAALPPAIPVGRFFYSGFTLLEMLLVLFIMGLLASAATVMTEGLDTQSRYDETKRRMEMVKRAIAGDPQRIINNQPDVSGFVADMGRPPATLKELIERGSLPEYAEDSTSGLSSGWRGPYLALVGTDKFSDGYGNRAEGSDVPDDFGWTYDAAASGVVSLTSKGADAADGADNIAALEMLVADDYEVAFSTVKINIHNRLSTPAAGTTLKLRIFYPIEGEIASDVGDTDSAAFVLPALSAVQSTQATATFTTPLEVPIGTRAFVVVCSSNDHVFDGDCDGPVPSAQHAVHFILAPRAQPAVLDWILQ